MRSGGRAPSSTAGTTGCSTGPRRAGRRGAARDGNRNPQNSSATVETISASTGPVELTVGLVFGGNSENRENGLTLHGAPAWSKTRSAERTGTGPGRAGSRAFVHALLFTLPMLLLPGVSQAQEQDMVLVSNMAGINAGGFVISPPDWEVVLGGITVGEGETRVAQQFTTGANTEGYTLRSVALNLRQERGTGSQAQVAIHRDSFGIPGTRLAVLNTPKAPFGTTSGAAGNRTFSAAGALSLSTRRRSTGSC